MSGGKGVNSIVRYSGSEEFYPVLIQKVGRVSPETGEGKGYLLEGGSVVWRGLLMMLTMHDIPC